MKAITTLHKREEDDWGSGDFGASRGGRPHKGIDYECNPGDVIISPVTGKVTKLGYCYSDDLHYRYVQISENNRDHRIFYIDPVVLEGEYIKKDKPIGVAQNVAVRYTTKDKYMKPHIHYEVLVNGEAVNPEV